jgi:hypothetical protein
VTPGREVTCNHLEAVAGRELAVKGRAAVRSKVNGSGFARVSAGSVTAVLRVGDQGSAGEWARLAVNAVNAVQVGQYVGYCWRRKAGWAGIEIVLRTMDLPEGG